MGNIFGTIRDMDSTLIDDINADPDCRAPNLNMSDAYSTASHLYRSADTEDYFLMTIAMHERSSCKPGRIKDYHEWIALYMHAEMLTTEEMNYRLQLAKRINDHG